MFKPSVLLPWFCSVALIGVWTLYADAQAQPKGAAGGAGAPKAGAGGVVANPGGANAGGNAGGANAGGANAGGANPGGAGVAPKAGAGNSGGVPKPRQPNNPGGGFASQPTFIPKSSPPPQRYPDYQGQMMKGIADYFQNRAIMEAMVASAIQPNPNSSMFNSSFSNPMMMNPMMNNTMMNPMMNNPMMMNPMMNPLAVATMNPMMMNNPMMNNPMMMNNPWAMNNPMMNNPWAMNNPMMNNPWAMNNPMMMQPTNPWNQQPFAAPGIFGPNNFNQGLQPGVFANPGFFRGGF